MNPRLQDKEDSGRKFTSTEARALTPADGPVPGAEVAGQGREEHPLPSPLAGVPWPEPKTPMPDGSHRTLDGAPGRAGERGRAAEHASDGMMPGAGGHVSPVSRALALVSRLPRLALRVPILIYRYTLSSFMGRQCRYLPTCSAYADEAISRHGAWPGLFMATARICRCHPWGGYGYDPVPQCLPVQGRWYAPWRYGLWRMPPAEPDETGEDEAREPVTDPVRET